MAQQVSNIRALAQRVLLSLEERSLVLVDVDARLPQGWRVDLIGRLLREELQLQNNVGGVNLHLWKIFYVALRPDFDALFDNLTMGALIQRDCCRSNTYLAVVQDEVNGRLAQITAQVTQHGNQLAELTAQVTQQGNQLAELTAQVTQQGNQLAQLNANINAILQHLGIAQAPQ